MWKNTANKPACTYQHILHFIEGERITVSAVQTAIPKREWHFSFSAEHRATGANYPLRPLCLGFKQKLA